MPPTLMAGLLYIGAGLGMGLIALIRKASNNETKEAKLTGSELPYTAAMILLDIAAPICLLIGLSSTTAANASLLNNFEIVATAIIAYYAIAPFIGTLLSLVIFRESPHTIYLIALGLMMLGAWLCAKDEPLCKKNKK